MKIVFVGDIHGRFIWQEIYKKHHDADKFVFVGDYLDTKDDILPVEQLHNLKNIVALKKAHQDQVTLLIGNHDYHYFPGIGDQNASGFQARLQHSFGIVLQENRGLFQMAFMYENILATHAGAGNRWLFNQNYNMVDPIDGFINDLWLYRPSVFQFTSGERLDHTGTALTQTPIWIRPVALMHGNKDTYLEGKYTQVVGHTSMHYLSVEDNPTNNGYFFIDTLGTSREFLVWKDGGFYADKLN